MKTIYDNENRERRKPRGVTMNDSTYELARVCAKELNMTVSQYVEFLIKNYKVSYILEQRL